MSHDIINTVRQELLDAFPMGDDLTAFNLFLDKIRKELEEHDRQLRAEHPRVSEELGSGLDEHKRGDVDPEIAPEVSDRSEGASAADQS